MRAIAEAMRTEYRMIVDAGFLLQLDDARAAVTYDRMVPPASFADYRKWLALHIEVLNHAIDGTAAGPHPLSRLLGKLAGPAHHRRAAQGHRRSDPASVKVGAYVIEGANPRHEHEWKVWKDVKLPEGKVLIPGVISHATNVVEHPELVAERIVRLAQARRPRERASPAPTAASRRGRSTAACIPSIMWAKLEALAEGARLASKELWK